MKFFTKIFIISLCTILTVSLTACGGNGGGDDASSNVEQADSNQKEYSMSDQVDIGNMEIGISNVYEDTEIGQDNEFMESIRSRGKFVNISMVISNLGNEEITVNTSEFKLLSDGKLYSPSVDPAVVEALGDSFLFYKSINPNMDMLGMIVFEVPSDLTDYSLVVEPVTSNQKAIIHLDNVN